MDSKTTAQKYVENARQGWWKARLYKGYAIIQQTEKPSERKYTIYNANGETIAHSRTQYQAKLYVNDDLLEEQA